MYSYYILTLLFTLLLVQFQSGTLKGDLPTSQHAAKLACDVLTPQTSCAYDYVNPHGNMLVLVDDYSQVADDSDEVTDTHDGPIQSKEDGEKRSPTVEEWTHTNRYNATLQPEMDQNCHLNNYVSDNLLTGKDLAQIKALYMGCCLSPI